MLERSSVSLDDDGAVGVAEELAALHRASVDPHALKIETIGLPLSFFRCAQHVPQLTAQNHRRETAVN